MAIRAPLSAFLSTSFCPYSFINLLPKGVTRLKTANTKNPAAAARPVRGSLAFSRCALSQACTSAPHLRLLRRSSTKGATSRPTLRPAIGDDGAIDSAANATCEDSKKGEKVMRDVSTPTAGLSTKGEVL